MKTKLTIAILVVLVLVGFCVFDELYVSNTFEAFTQMLKEQEQKKTYDLAELKQLNDWWENAHKKLEVIVPHTLLNEITFAFGELLGAVIADDTKSAEGQLHRLIETSESMQEMYSISLGNLL